MYVCPQIFAATKRPLQRTSQPADSNVHPDCGCT